MTLTLTKTGHTNKTLALGTLTDVWFPLLYIASDIAFTKYIGIFDTDINEKCFNINQVMSYSHFCGIL